jgi:hypothetical protein
MADLPALASVASVERFLKHIQTAGKPEKVARTYLKSVGFTSSNDSYLVGLFKTLGFLDGSGAPTKRWVAYKDTTKARAVLAEGIRHAYAGMFATFPDANRKDDEAIRNWIRANHPELSAEVVSRAVRTFKTLCGFADFDTKLSDDEAVHLSDDNGVAAADVRLPSSAAPVATSGPVINVNVQLQLPPTDDADVYDKLFEAMKRHLFPDVG